MSTKQKAYVELILYTAIWGACFPLTKQGLDYVDPISMMALRFTIGAAVLIILSRKRLGALTVPVIKEGLVLGVLLYITVILQSFGINETSSSNAAFISSIYVVLVPVFVSFRSRIQLSGNNILALVLVVGGLLLVSGMIHMEEGQILLSFTKLNRGDVLTLLSSFGFGGYILLSNKYTQRRDPRLLTMINIVLFAVMADITLLFMPHMKMEVMNGRMAAILVITGIFGAAVCYLGMIEAQRNIGPIPLVLILSLMPVFAMVFAFLIPNRWGQVEVATGLEVAGCILIMGSILISEMAGLHNTRSLNGNRDGMPRPRLKAIRMLLLRFGNKKQL